MNHEYREKNNTIIEQRFMPSRGRIKIRDDVWIGANTTILNGTVINKGAVIRANSLVQGEIEPYCVYAGNPLKQIERKT